MVPVIPAGYPQIPLRAKLAVAPYAILALLLLFKLDDWGVVDLLAPPPAHRLPAAPPSRAARADVPAGYLQLYQRAGAGQRWPDRRTGRRYPAWSVLAGIGKVESDHGRSPAPGVRSGVNRFGCCAGPMQFNLRNGPPSTWARYGRGDVYDPADAIPAAGRKLRADGAARDLRGALFAYNHAARYVAEVLTVARSYQAPARQKGAS